MNEGGERKHQTSLRCKEIRENIYVGSHLWLERSIFKDVRKLITYEDLWEQNVWERHAWIWETQTHTWNIRNCKLFHWQILVICIMFGLSVFFI